MTVPIRPQSPLIAARPQVLTRRVSLRLGPLGLTYTTDRLLYSQDEDPPPVTPAAALGPHQGQTQAEPAAPQRSFLLDLEAARQQALWQAAGQDTAGQAAVRHQPPVVPGAVAGREAPEREAGRTADSAESRQGGQAAQAGRPSATASAMRRAIRAYLSCAHGFGCARPMLQAVA